MLQNLNRQTPVVNPDGTPTEFFMRVLQERGIFADETEGSVAAKANKSLTLTAGAGLAGGGTLETDREFNLDAVLDNLNDVDTTTTPPTDGQVIQYDATSGLWLPATPASGGGGGSSRFLLPYIAADPLANGSVWGATKMVFTLEYCMAATSLTGIMVAFKGIPVGLELIPAIYDAGPSTLSPIRPDGATLVATGPKMTPLVDRFNAAPFSTSFTPTVGNVYFVGLSVFNGGNFNFMRSGFGRRVWFMNGLHDPVPATCPAPSGNVHGDYSCYWTY